MGENPCSNDLKDDPLCAGGLYGAPFASSPPRPASTTNNNTNQQHQQFHNELSVRYRRWCQLMNSHYLGGGFSSTELTPGRSMLLGDFLRN